MSFVNNVNVTPSAMKPSDFCHVAETLVGLSFLRVRTCGWLVRLSPWALKGWVDAVGKAQAIAFLNEMDERGVCGRKKLDAEILLYWALNDAIFGHGATGYGVSPDHSTDDLLAMADSIISKFSWRNEHERYYVWGAELGRAAILTDALGAALGDLSKRLPDESHRNQCRLAADFLFRYVTSAPVRKRKAQGGAA